MKYMIISDIHGDLQCLKQAMNRFEEEKADVLLVLGDLLYHGPRNPIPEGYAPKECAQLYNEYKDRIITVRGNCDADVDQMMVDFAITAPYMILPLEGGGRMVLTHGHNPMEDLHIQKGDLLLSGHTHVLKAEQLENYAWVNPGSISLPKENNPKTYATLEGRTVQIKTMDGKVHTEFEF